MHTFDETSCAKGKPLRSLWTADEARMVKHILNNLTVKQWNLPSTEVERDLSGDWTIWIPEGGGSMGTWSGMVWILGQLKYDFSRVDADPEGEELDPPGIAVGGVYLVIDLLTQDYSWTSTLPLGPDGYAHKNYYPVGVELSLPSVGFSSSSNRVVGDIRIDMVPYYAPLEEELPSAPPPT